MKQILCFGDSNTYGLIPATHDRYDYSVRWTGRIADKVRNFDEHIRILLISPIWLGDEIWNGYDPEFDSKSVETSKQLGSVYEQIAEDEQIEFLRASDFSKASVVDREHLDSEEHSRLATGIWQKINEIVCPGQNARYM